jgi:ketosteroid isomerase-like protein
MTHDHLIQRYAIRCVGEAFADAANRHDFDRFAELWTDEGVWDIGAPINVRFEGRAAIREGIEKMLGRWDFFVHMPHAFDVSINGDRAKSCWTVHEVARSADKAIGNSNLSLYFDELVRTSEGWRFTSRRYRTIYADETALTGVSFSLTAP